MQYDAQTPEEYLSLLEEDWRKEKVQQIRNMILESNPSIQEGIEYKMLAYGIEGKNIFALNAQKGYVSLYVGNIDKIDPERTLLGGFDMGKGCIRIKKSLPLEETRIREFIEKTIKLQEEGKDIDC